MIDLHSHLLPNLDDGSRSLEQSVRALTRFAEVGVSHVVLTPHLRASEIDQFGEDTIAQRDETLEILAPEAPNPPSLYLGFEIMVDLPMPPRALGDRRYSLAESKYYLVEFPMAVAPDYATRVLEQISEAGVIPLVAHPERYRACRVEAIAAWKAVGAKMQVDSTTLTTSSDRGRRARQILEAGLADVLAADNHGDQRTLQAGIDYVRSAGAPDVALLLTVENPLAVIEDREMREVAPVKLGETFLERVKRFVRG
jgi:protein-tyrosine phosphatase